MKRLYAIRRLQSCLKTQMLPFVQAYHFRVLEMYVDDCIFIILWYIS